MNKKRNAGLTLVELLIYTAIFAVSALFLVGILGVTTKIQTRQSSANEINQQIAAVQDIVKRLVQESSLIENTAGASSSTLVLRTSATATDKTFIYLSRSVLYLEQGTFASGTGVAQRITSEKVKVDSFNVTKYENPGGLAVVQVNLVLSASTTNPQSAFTRTMQTGIARISAATFDSDILPNGGTLKIGNSGSPTWEKIFLSIGAASTPSYAFAGVSGVGMFGVANGLAFSTAGSERLRIDSNGNIGIGTSNPSMKLDVNGDVKISTVSGSGKLVCVKANGALGACTLSGGACTPCQ